MEKGVTLFALSIDKVGHRDERQRERLCFTRTDRPEITFGNVLFVAVLAKDINSTTEARLSVLSFPPCLQRVLDTSG